MSLLLLFKTGIQNQNVGGALTPAGALTKSTQRALAGALTPAATLAKVTQRALQGSVATITGALLKQLQRTLTAAVTPSASLETFKVRLVSLAGSVASSGALVRLTFRALTGSVAPQGSIVKRLARLLAGLLAPLGALTSKHRHEGTVTMTIGGVDRTNNVRLGSLEVEDVLNDEPNRCTFVCSDFVPAEGAVVSITRGPAAEVEFAGHILQVQQIYEGILANVAYFVTCEDYTWSLNRRLVTKRWTNVSASTIATEVITGFTSGFTTTNVVGALATVTEFECVLDKPAVALSRLAAEIGGNWYVDYNKDLHFFLTETTSAPEDISDATLATTTARGLAHVGDLSQARTRVAGVGVGTSTLEQRPASATTVPVEAATMFESAGGKAIAGPNLMDYTGKHAGGVAGTVVGNTAAPSGAPAPAVASGQVGVLVGAYQYKVAFANDQGETAAGPASGTVTGVAFTTPGAAAVAAVLSTLGRLVGAYNYVVTFVTSLGETTAGTQFGRTAAAATIPATPTTAVTGSMGNLIGAYNYRTTFVGAEGIESESSLSSSITANAATGPTAPSGFASNAPGPLGGGTYNWKVSFVTADGRESLGSAGAFTIAIAPAPAAPSITSSGTGTIHYRVSFFHPTWGETPWSAVATDTTSGNPADVTVSGLYSGCGFKVYSTGTGFASTDPYYFVGQVNPGGGSTFTHGGQGGPRSDSPAAILGSFCDMTIQTGPPGTVARRIYRTKVGGSVYYLCGEVPDNSTTTFRDTVPDWDLTAAAPTANLNGQQINVTNIQTGVTGTVKRRVYRTKAGGSLFGLLAEIQDNVTTAYVDNIPDDSLNMGVSIPAFVGERHCGEKHSITGIPTGPTGTLARRIYRTVAGGTELKLLIEIPDNATTSYTDNKLDAELGGESPPLVNTAGASKFSLTSIPTGGAGVTKRILYRTEAGGSVFKYVGTIDDNTSTAFTDNVPDTSLGRVALTVGTIGAVEGDTTLTLDSVTGFPNSGWVKADSQLIFYGGISGTTLTSIPASGIGAILNTIKGGASVVTAPFISGVTGIQWTIERGDPIHIYVVRNDAAAQTALAALEGGDGIHEAPIRDVSIETVAGLNTACDAELAAWSTKLRTVTFRSRDTKLRSGKTVTLSLGAPTNISGSFLIQRVVSTEFDSAYRIVPMRDVIAAPVRLSFQEVIRRQRKNAA